MNKLSKQLITNKTIFIFSTIVILSLLVLSVDEEIFKPIPAPDNNNTAKESNPIVVLPEMKFFNDNWMAITFIVILPAVIIIFIAVAIKFNTGYDD